MIAYVNRGNYHDWREAAVLMTLFICIALVLIYRYYYQAKAAQPKKSDYLTERRQQRVRISELENAIVTHRQVSKANGSESTADTALWAHIEGNEIARKVDELRGN